MKPIVKGMFARSLAGHDKGKLYVISDGQEPYVFLVDGKIRTAARPGFWQTFLSQSVS